MIIDFHTHIFPDSVALKAIPKLANIGKIINYTDGTKNSLIESMNNANIDISLVLPVATTDKQVISINNYAVELNKDFDNSKILSFGTMHPQFEDVYNELLRIKSLGIKGIKLHPDYQDTFIDDKLYINIINNAFKLGLIVITHTGVDVGIAPPIKATPDRILNVLDNLEYEGTFVLAHMGGFMLWDEALIKLKDRNLYFDTAVSIGSIVHDNKKIDLIDSSKFRKFIDTFGIDKILFATDSPWGNQTDMVNTINSFELSISEKNKILFQNALNLLKIKV